MQMYLSKVKIREAMDRQRIKTYTELAEQLGITKNQLSVMLSDDYNPLKTRVEDLCQLLSVAPNEIMDFSTDTKGIDTSMIKNDDVTAIELFAGAGVKEVNPKIFMAENVRGLVSHDKGRTLTTIINVLEALGYHTQQKILNAAYFGVGQKRERIVIVGIRNDTDIEFSYPNEEDKMTTLREALKGCPKSDGVEYSEKKKKVLALVPPGGCWVDLPEDIAKEYMGKSYYSGGGRRGMARRISWEEPCLTLTCSPSQKQTERCHPEETRPFTVRESARIQSFPDDWTFCGGIGDQYKQIGNAVPVEMARRIGIQLKEAVLSEQKG